MTPDRRPLTWLEAAERVAAWSDRRIPPKPWPFPFDFDLQEACDGLCRWLAEDPERELDGVPEALLMNLRTRILFAFGAAMLQPTAIIGHPPSNATDEQLLAGLLGVQIAGTRVPPEWRPQ